MKHLNRLSASVLMILSVQAGFAVTHLSNLSDFDSSLFLNNGPHQQGTVKIDRSKTQTVVTWCSPTLLKMRVYDDVNDNYPTYYRQVKQPKKGMQDHPLKEEQHPLQVSITVFTPSLPFKYASNYGTPAYVTSVCSPSSIHTTLSSPKNDSIQKDSEIMQFNLGQPFKVSGKKLSVISVNCKREKAEYLQTDRYNGTNYGLIGGAATLPSGTEATVVAHCQPNGLTININ